MAIFIAASSLSAPAAEPANAPAQASALPPSHATAVESALKSLANRRDIDADTKKQAEDLLHQAQDDEAHADQLALQRQSLAQAAATADADAQKIEDALARDPSTSVASWRAALPAHTTTEQLESLLSQERNALTDARAAVASLQAELARQTTRPAQLREELTGAHAALDDIAAAPPSGKSGTNILGEAQMLRNQAAQRLATIRISLLNLENSSYESRVRLLSAQLRERQRAQSELTQHVDILESLLLEQTSVAIVELQKRATQERAEIGERSHILADAADTNVKLATQLGDAVRGFSQLRTQQQDWDKALRDTTQSLKNTEERIRIGGSNEAVGLILLAEKSRLKPLQVLKRELEALQGEFAKSRTMLIDLREQQDALANADSATTEALAQLPAMPKEREDEIRTHMSQLLNERTEILAQVVAQITRLASAQSDAESELRNLVATTEKLTTILDSRLLWTPSHKPVDASWFKLFSAGSNAFIAARWAHAFGAGWAAALKSPLRSFSLIALLVVFVLLALRAPKQLEKITQPMRRIRSDRYRYTGAALFWTLAAAMPLPFALWLIGSLLQLTVPPGNGFADEAGLAFEQVALPAFVFTFLRALTMENGLAQYHFRWPRPRRRSLYAAAPWLGLSLLPAQFLVNFMVLRNNSAALDSFGRLLLMVALFVVGIFSWWLLAPGRVWTVRDTTLQEPLRLRQMARIVLVGGCGVLILFVLRGYFVTALTLSTRVFQTLAVLLAAWVLYGLAARWLVLGERRLALKRMEERAAAATAEEPRSPDGEVLPEPEPEEITLASVSAQTRKLLRTVIAIALVAVLLWVWSDVAPALTLLGDTQVWNSSDVIDGKAIALKVSLRDILEALVVFALTWIATRNVPGFLEVGVLRRFHVDAPSRYAITAVTRYLLVFIGVMVGISRLGLRWANLQWLAAGFSVGLGFGLQEIFANFISGLMVLFERPFRVGDIITIGNVEGTVTRIRTRATTIVDWDNREVIVPNKTFLTERLVNWTLSDSTTRIVVKVGIAYRNDPKLAQRLMLKIADVHPQVLKDPAPSCWLIAFGGSTQDFELRVYVADIGQRNPVRTEIQFRIAEAFAENDIEMAFPQMDLWFRNKLDTQVDDSKEAKPTQPNADASNDSKRS